MLDARYTRPALPDYGPTQGTARDPIEEAPPQTIDRLVDALGDLGIGEDGRRALAVFGQAGVLRSASRPPLPGFMRIPPSVSSG